MSADIRAERRKRVPGETGPTTRRWLLGGRIQGVGFRPFVHALARRYGLDGHVRNRGGGVEILVRGTPDGLADFGAALLREAPPPARPRLISSRETNESVRSGFTIDDSEVAADDHGVVTPDQSLCEDCYIEMRDPRSRRYRYPFTTCARCGPRYTIIEAPPFDRRRTAMVAFPPCPACRVEQDDPGDRRFHAQTLACPDCGPRVRFSGRDGADDIDGGPAIDAAIALLRAGGIVAVKGIGGYHLLCDPGRADAIARLRRLKPRPDKPLALMFADHGGLDRIRAVVDLDAVAVAALRDPARPIVIAPLQPAWPPAEVVAPGLADIGVMLAYSPLHQLLLDGFEGPLVATSANPRGEPVLSDNDEAASRLAAIADGFLHHDRPILRQADDPVRRVIAGHPRRLRLGRGDAPLEVALPFTLKEPLLAVGGHLKNTVALAFDDRALISPHLGTPDSPRGEALFLRTIADLQTLHGVSARRVICDAHPGYPSRQRALAFDLPVTEVFHHRAHAAIVAGEQADRDRWLVFCWDGFGYGEDGTLWGGEALLGAPGAWRRVASLRPFRIPGARTAGREPWRSALSLCLETGRDWPARPAAHSALFAEAWRGDFNTVTTSSAGRLFDAAAALCGLTLDASYEGQGPMRLEALAASISPPFCPELPLQRGPDGIWRSDWAPLVDALLDDALSPALRAALFHDALALALRDQARGVREHHGDFAVGLSGGVFQNRRLTETVLRLLADDGFDARLPAIVPYNDAGLSFGQIIEGAHSP